MSWILNIIWMMVWQLINFLLDYIIYMLLLPCLLSLLPLAKCHISLFGHYYYLWPVASELLPARRIVCTLYLLFLYLRSFLCLFIFILHPSPCFLSMVRSQNVQVLADTVRGSLRSLRTRICLLFVKNI